MKRTEASEMQKLAPPGCMLAAPGQFTFIE
jgi:hypothetical protein